MLFQRLAFTFFFAINVFAVSPSAVTRKIASLIQESSAVQHGRFGFEFVDVDSGQVLASLDSAHFFTPASNAKLYTTALALVRLGPNYTFQTELRTTGSWAPGQPTLSGLQLIGGGDPNLSGRVLPYAVDSVDGDPLAPLKDLASKVAAAGVRAIDGDITGIATRYPGSPYPDGWTIDDSLYSYGAPVSALALNDNTVAVTVYPSELGQLAGIELRPPSSYFVILNEVLTDPSSRTDIHVARSPGSEEIVLWGAIGSTASRWREDLAVDNPALFAAEALVDALREAGVVVRGVARSQYLDASEIAGKSLANAGAVLARHDSVPLSEELQVINKVSQNLHAEMLLREVAHVLRGVGTLEAGLAERDAFLQEIGITRDGSGFSLDDGSGLARQDLTTPQSTVALLRYMWQRPDRDVWLQSLPIGGVDGSLEHRFHKIPGAKRVHAKTGSLSHVNALSGYIETGRHRWLAFSVMVNATPGHDSEVRNFIDRLCALFLDD